MEELLGYINKLYGLQMTSHQEVMKGYLSENYILTSRDSTKYFLKKYRFDSEDKIKEIHSVKKFFAEDGIPVILPIPTIDGNTYFFYLNGYYTLFPFVEGVQYEGSLMIDKAIVSLAEMCAKIHLRGKRDYPRILERFKPWNKNISLEKIEKILEVISGLKDKTAFDNLALESCVLKKKLIEESQINFEDLELKCDHLIHGDYLDHNVFFNENSEIMAVFDFEKADMSPREYELFRSMMLTFLHGTDSDVELENVKKYLQAYLAVYPMIQSQIGKGFELFYQKQIHGMWVESEHYLKNNTRTDLFLEIELKRLKYMYLNKDRIMQALVSIKVLEWR